MGFLTQALGLAASIFLPPAQQPAAAAAPAPAPSQPSPAGVKPSVLDLAEVADRGVVRAKGTLQGELDVGATRARARGGMKNRRDTIVRTIAPDGTVLDREFLEGAPFLMNKDIVQLKRTIALIQKADERLPRPRQRGIAQGKELAKLKGQLQGLLAVASASGRAVQVIDTGG